MLEELRFSVPELLSLIGVAQSLYIIIYMTFRAGRLSRTGLPLLYFSLLFLAFAADFSFNHVGYRLDYFKIIQHMLWLSLPPVSVLLAIQVAQITKLPDIKYHAVLLLPFVSFGGAILFATMSHQCDAALTREDFETWLIILGQASGSISLLSIWLAYKIWSPLYAQKSGRERYWLIIAIIVLNTGYLVSLFAAYSPDVSYATLIQMRTVLGLGFVYLVMTSLFRIYPPSVRMLPASESDETLLSDREMELALKIEGLMTYEKVYHEPGYTRSDLAQELGVPETTASKIINLHFKKSLPQMLNEYRVEDAKNLLIETQAEVNVIAQEAGSNSLASFNRVFKEITGESPTQFRARKRP